MAPDTRPTHDAIVATVDGPAAADAIVADIGGETTVGADDVAHGSGEAFAAELEGGSADSGPASRVSRWLTSLGQDRERLVEAGQAAREGRTALVVNGVDDDVTKEAVIAILQRHGADGITYLGDWQNEDIL